MTLFQVCFPLAWSELGTAASHCPLLSAAFLSSMREVCSCVSVTGVSLSSDFIAGFCGETEEDHQQTVSLLREVRYNVGFLFAYSMRQVSAGPGGEGCYLWVCHLNSSVLFVTITPFLKSC